MLSISDFAYKYTGDLSFEMPIAPCGLTRKQRETGLSILSQSPPVANCLLETDKEGTLPPVERDVIIVVSEGPSGHPPEKQTAYRIRPNGTLVKPGQPNQQGGE